MKTLIITLISVLVLSHTTQSIAQNGEVRSYSSSSYVYTPTPATTNNGSVNITVTDSRINSMVDAHRSANQRDNTVKGYRVQILQDNNRSLMQQEKQKLQKMYPQLEIYELYESPFFKLRVGNYKDRFEAYQMYHKLKRNFKRAFIVPDKVNPSAF